MFDVTEYGAKGNGETDDTEAIQEAVEAAIAAGGGVVFFPTGEYAISSQINVDGDFITLAGEGESSKVIRKAETDLGRMIKFNESGGPEERLSNICVRDLYLDMSWEGNEPEEEQGCLTVFNTDGVLFENVYVKDALDRGISTAGCTQVRLHGCTVDGTHHREDAGNAINVSSTKHVAANQVSIIGCHVLNYDDMGIYVSANPESATFDMFVTVVGCTAEGGNSGINVEGQGFFITISGNVVRGCDTRCIGVGTAASSESISNSNVVVADNSLDLDEGQGAIVLTGRDLVISGNTITYGSTWGILYGAGNEEGLGYDDGNTVISGNTLRAKGGSASEGVKLTKSGDSEFPLSNVDIVDNVIEADSASGAGIRLHGRLSEIRVAGNAISEAGTLGILTTNDGEVGPRNVAICDNMIKNCNQQGQGPINGSGISLKGGSKITVSDNVCTDDQEEKTQLYGLALEVNEEVTARNNDFRGNKSGGISGSLALAEGNLTVEAPYSGSVTLEGGEATVETAAINPTAIVELAHGSFSGTQGALYVDSMVGGEKFVIKSTSETDAAVVRWRIR